MQQKNIHWFPGHMKKALKEIEERLKIMDVLIEILDARIPLSSRNPFLEKIAPQKKRLLILAKKDLANTEETQNWIEYFQEKGQKALALDLTSPTSDGEIKKAIQQLGKEKWLKDQKRGLKPQPIKAMIIGIPNVGKSTLINRLSRRNAASVRNTPGHTRAQQWIKVDQLFELLDTPGILPMHYEKEENAVHLAWVGSIREDILPLSQVADTFLTWMKEESYPTFAERYRLTKNKDENHDIFVEIAQNRGFLTANGVDIEKAERLILKEFREGKFGAITIEKRNAYADL